MYRYTEVDEEEEEEESWEGITAPGSGEGGGDAGDAAADMLGAFFSDSDDEDEAAEAAAAAAAKAKAEETADISGQVLAREAVRLEAAVEEVLKRALGGGLYKCNEVAP